MSSFLQEMHPLLRKNQTLSEDYLIKIILNQETHSIFIIMLQYCNHIELFFFKKFSAEYISLLQQSGSDSKISEKLCEKWILLIKSNGSPEI